MEEQRSGTNMSALQTDENVINLCEEEADSQQNSEQIENASKEPSSSDHGNNNANTSRAECDSSSLDKNNGVEIIIDSDNDVEIIADPVGLNNPIGVNFPSTTLREHRLHYDTGYHRLMMERRMQRRIQLADKNYWGPPLLTIDLTEDEPEIESNNIQEEPINVENKSFIDQRERVNIEGEPSINIEEEPIIIEEEDQNNENFGVADSSSNPGTIDHPEMPSEVSQSNERHEVMPDDYMYPDLVNLPCMDREPNNAVPYLSSGNFYQDILNDWNSEDEA